MSRINVEFRGARLLRDSIYRDPTQVEHQALMTYQHSCLAGLVIDNLKRSKKGRESFCPKLVEWLYAHLVAAGASLPARRKRIRIEVERVKGA